MKLELEMTGNLLWNTRKLALECQETFCGMPRNTFCDTNERCLLAVVLEHQDTLGGYLAGVF